MEKQNMKKLLRLAPLTMVLLVLTSCGDGTKLEAAEAKEAWAKAQNTQITEYPTTLQAKMKIELLETMNGQTVNVKTSASYRIDKNGNVYADTTSGMKLANQDVTMTAKVYIVDSVGYIETEMAGSGQNASVKMKGDIGDILDSAGLPTGDNQINVSSLISEIQTLILTFPEQAGIIYEDVDAYVKGEEYTFKVENDTGNFSLVFNGQYFTSAKMSSDKGSFDVSFSTYKGTVKVSNPDSYLDLSSFGF